MIQNLIKESASKKGRLRRAISRESEKLRKSFRESVLYGTIGAATAPALTRIYQAIEQKKLKPAQSGKFYRVGKVKIPASVLASSVTGFTAAGILPYVRERVHQKRVQKAVEKKLSKTAQGHSAALKIAPHLRGLKKTHVPEYTKRHAQKLLNRFRDVAHAKPGEFRA